MKTRHSILPALALPALALLLTSVPVASQQITGTPGAPSATTTIPGDQLPAPPQKFEGVINDTAQESKPYWPMRIVPPQGAPNVLLIITDDAGYGVPSTFGGVMRRVRCARRELDEERLIGRQRIDAIDVGDRVVRHGGHQVPAWMADIGIDRGR